MGTELKDTFVQAYNDTYDYIDRYLTSKLPTRDLNRGRTPKRVS